MRSRSVSLDRVERSGVLAFTWAVLFALLSFCWAAGGNFGIDQLSPGLQEEAEKREPGFVSFVWLSGAVKMIGGLIPLALAYQLWVWIPRRLLTMLTWLGGVFLTLYGVGDIVVGTIGVMNGNSQYGFWYAVLWGPIWLIGGVLFLATAWLNRRRPTSDEQRR